MPTNIKGTSVAAGEAGREVLVLIRRIQELMLELEALRQRGRSERELRARERRLEQLRWRLAAVARRAATARAAVEA
jgi:hypothetical protein